MPSCSSTFKWGENPMTSRQATDALKGYLYQFDLTILNLLNLKDPESIITIEGIEDVDITIDELTTAVQCKYHSKREYNHSVIAKPIRLMLHDFKERLKDDGEIINYKLYGHFKSGQHKLTLPLELDFLKEKILTYTKNSVEIKEHEVLGLTDSELEVFRDNLSVNIHASDFENQYSEIIGLLMSLFHCDKYTAENHYYNNALKVIKDYSILEKENQRRITKKQFITKIDNTKVLFNKWFVLYKGKKNFLKELRMMYFTSLNTSPFDRFFLIEIDKHNYSRPLLKELLLKISNKWSKLSKRSGDKTFCPYIYIFNLDYDELLAIKNEFTRENIIFVDGHPYLGADFSVNSITTKPNHHNGIQLKIINESIHIQQILRSISNTREIYQFYFTNPFFELDDEFEGIKHIKIQIENINDIGEII